MALAVLVVAASAAGTTPTIASAALETNGRAFEMVTPEFMNGGARVSPLAIADDGDRVLYSSASAFANAEGLAAAGGWYQAVRTPSGWQTTALMPGGSAIPGYSAPVAYSTNLLRTYWDAFPAEVWGTTERRPMFRQDDGNGNATWIPAAPPMPVGPTIASTLDRAPLNASAADLSAVVLGVVGDRATVNDGSTDTRVAAQPSQHRIERRPDGSFEVIQLAKRADGTTIAPACRSRIGGGNANTTSRGAADSSLSRIVIGIFGTGSTTCALPADSRVWVWIRNQGIVDVSASACTDMVACGAAKVTNFEGASRDVRRVYFSTAQKLTDGNTATGSDAVITDLYEYDFDRIGPRLIPITPGKNPPGVPLGTAGSGVNRVARVSPDGSRAYFVANGRALAGPNARGQSPTPAGRNLYVYHRPDGAASGTIKFVATLATSDSVIWGQDAARKVETGGQDGRYLYFVSRARLTADEDAADTMADIFRYDAQTEQLQRVWRSGPMYNGANRTADSTFSTPSTVPNQAQAEWQESKVISPDGEQIFFETAQSLVEADENEKVDGYVWDGRDGSVVLVSGGRGVSDVVTQAMTPNGANLLFSSATQLVPQHSSPIPAAYVSRLGGGFAPPPLPAPPCVGDACQGDRKDAPGLVGGGGSETAQGTNVVEADLGLGAAARVTASPSSPSRKRATARLRIRATVSGRARVTGRGIVTRNVRVRGGASTVITVRLTKSGRAALRKKRGAARIAGRVVLSPDNGKSVRTDFTVKFAAPVRKRGAR